MPHRLLSGWTAPTAATEPRDALAWVRRMEIVSGVACIVAGLVLWNDGWWHWLLIALGVLALTPISGAAAVLRRADRKPDTLVSEPERRRARARRTAILLVPTYVLVGAVFGYVADGWGAAVTIAILMGLGGGLGAWWTARRFR
jgi:hypothetical protein